MAVVGWILLSLLLLIIILLIAPIGVTFEYTDTWKMRVLLFGFIPVWRMNGDRPPSHDKEEVAVPPAPPDKEKEDKPSLVEELKAFYKEEGLKGVLSLFKTLVGIAKKMVTRIAHSMTISRLQLCVRVGGEQADKIAVRYGQVCSVLFPALTTLSSSVRIRRPQVSVQPDFLAEGMSVRMRMKMYIFPLGVVCAGIAALVKLVGVWSGVTKATQPDHSQNIHSESKKI